CNGPCHNVRGRRCVPPTAKCLRFHAIAPGWNMGPASCVSALGIDTDDEPRAEVHYDAMPFFTHQVNGQTYGGWYRQLAPHEIEIMGAGFLCKTSYAGSDELSVARSVLEEFV